MGQFMVLVGMGGVGTDLGGEEMLCPGSRQCVGVAFVSVCGPPAVYTCCGRGLLHYRSEMERTPCLVPVLPVAGHVLTASLTWSSKCMKNSTRWKYYPVQ